MHIPVYIRFNLFYLLIEKEKKKKEEKVKSGMLNNNNGNKLNELLNQIQKRKIYAYFF